MGTTCVFYALGPRKASSTAKRDIIAIGGSAGSTSALKQIMAGLPADFPGSIFVATHIPRHATSRLSTMLARSGPLPVSQAIDGQPIERGQVYVAAPDRHLLVIDGTVRLGDGPRENFTRPAIDPLFRSAALSYGARVVGVVLSGMLNDGASGLCAIKQRGGTAIVQHPLEAEVDQMPLAALETVQTDEVAPAADLARLLDEFARSDAGEDHPATESLELEVEIAGGARLGADALRKIAEPSALTCPDCNGVLSEVHDGKPLRYRCQTGHAQTAEILAARADEVNEAMRIALRVMEERVTLVSRMASDARDSGRKAVAELYEGRAGEYAGYATVLREATTAAMRVERDSGDNAH